MLTGSGTMLTVAAGQGIDLSEEDPEPLSAITSPVAASTTVRGAAGGHGTYTEHAGTAPAVSPGRAGIWTARAAGPGTQTLIWAPRSGDWVVVAMNADGSRPVTMQVNVAATLPALPWIAAGLLIAVPLRRASRH